MNFKVSVIVPIYKSEKYIEKCVCSLLEQTLDDVEYIFVDDATPDNSMQVLYQIIERYPHRANNCKVIHHKQNKGVAAARNTGLAASNGKYIIYCDSDDWVELTMFEEMYKVAEEQNSDIVICDFRMVCNNSVINFYSVDWTNDKIHSLQNYISYVWTVVWNMLVKRDIYMRNQLKSLEKNATYCEDFNLAVKLLFHADKVVHLNKVLYNYNQLNASSIMHNLNEKTMHDEQIMYLDVIDYLKNQGVYEKYKKQLCWRILKSKQEWVLKTETYNRFLKFYPESNQYIWSCPFIYNLKLRIMMWCLVHHLSLISRFMLLLRFLRHGK